jgi:hypothetical protein
MSSDPISDGEDERMLRKVEALRQRAKTHFPNVLLTLTSIIQALALETLWSSWAEEVERVGFEAIPLATSLQASALLIAIVLLWVYYAQLVMRLVWLPRLTDSLVPFALGLGQFIEADSLGTEHVALWLAPFPAIFLISFVAWNLTLERARMEPENAEVIAAFFPESALLRLGPMLGSVAILIVLAWAAWLWPRSANVQLVLLNLLLLAHLGLQGRYWRDSMGL